NLFIRRGIGKYPNRRFYVLVPGESYAGSALLQIVMKGNLFFEKSLDLTFEANEVVGLALLNFLPELVEVLIKLVVESLGPCHLNQLTRSPLQRCRIGEIPAFKPVNKGIIFSVVQAERRQVGRLFFLTGVTRSVFKNQPAVEQGGCHGAEIAVSDRYIGIESTAIIDEAA